MKNIVFKIRHALVVLAILFFTSGWSQQLNNPYTSVPPIQSFIIQQDAFWQGEISLYGEEAMLEEGSGYSQYLRWKTSTLQRISLDGNLSSYEAQLEYLCENPLPILEGSGIWTEMGPIRNA